ncbi:putative ATP-binding protein [Vibrio chagasii]|nr:putative ATP-binding protein [Vibrio chagasii]
MSTTPTVLPIIKTAHALTSLRESGFSFPASISELIDNSLEAGASTVKCKMYSDEKNVVEIATSDDGCGMTKSILHSYPVVGESTRFGAVNGIGKFGMGAKMGALAHCMKFSVYSRINGTDDYLYVEFDLERAMELESKGEAHLIGVAEPVAVTIPDKYSDVVDETTNTLVVWSKCDKLQGGKRSNSPESLSESLKDELSRAFRHFLYHGVKIEINGDYIPYFDPLMQMPNSVQDQILTNYYEPENANVNHYASTVIVDRLEVCRLGDEVATMSVVLYPKEVTRKASMGGDALARSLRVPYNQGRISFVRMGREISYTNVPNIFSRGVIGADRFIGIEIQFSPVFDSQFGVRHVKRGVEPFDVLRKEIRGHLKTYLPVAAKALRAAWDGQEMDIDFEEIERSVAKANQLMQMGTNEKRFLSDDDKESQRSALMELAKEIGVVDVEGFASRKAGKPYVIEVVDSNHTDFLDFRFMDSQVHIGLNKNHRMYSDVWAPLYEVSKQNASSVSLLNPVETANHALNALNIMLVCMAKTHSIEKVENFDSFVKEWGCHMDGFLREV